MVKIQIFKRQAFLRSLITKYEHEMKKGKRYYDLTLIYITSFCMRVGGKFYIFVKSRKRGCYNYTLQTHTNLFA